MQVDYLFAAAMLGKDAEEFFVSDLGRYVTGRADEEKQEALQSLAVIDPDDKDLIRKTQNQYHRAHSLLLWLGELIQEGKQAINTLESNDHDR